MALPVTYLDALKFLIVDRLFIGTADQNYIVARWCYQNGLFLDFCWNGLHALEKYLKASLLLNGETAKPYRHDIAKLYKKCHSYASEFLPDDFKNKEYIKSLKNESTLKFVERFGKGGDRYNTYGYSLHLGDLHKIDEVVYSVKRICVNLEANAFGRNISSGLHNISHREYLRMGDNHPSYGKFYTLTTDKKRPQLREAALRGNLSFAPENFQHGSWKDWSAFENPVLYQEIFEVLEKDQLNAEDISCADLADWVAQNIQLSSEDKREIEEAAQKIRAKPLAA